VEQQKKPLILCPRILVAISENVDSSTLLRIEI
jgi:hypothetical protein